MGQKISGTVAGTGTTDLTICCGFIPDKVTLREVTGSTPSTVELMKGHAATANLGGMLITGSTGATSVLTASTGIVPYKGGVKLTADSTSIMVSDPAPDKRKAGSLGVVTTWTLDTPASATGHINAGLAAANLGVGSKITIQGASGIGKEYTVTALSNDGDAANDITLNEAAPSGAILNLTGPYTFVGAKAGIVTPAGFTMTGATPVNISGDRLLFEAETFDN